MKTIKFIIGFLATATLVASAVVGRVFINIKSIELTEGIPEEELLKIRYDGVQYDYSELAANPLIMMDWDENEVELVMTFELGGGDAFEATADKNGPKFKYRLINRWYDITPLTERVTESTSETISEEWTFY